MKAFIFDIRRYTIHDGPGIRTTVFFKGCPLRCWWCHNPESQETGVEHLAITRALDGKLFENRQVVGRWWPVEQLMAELEKDEVFFMESGGGVTFSGGEPLMQPDALKSLLMQCKEKGYHTAVDTSGHAEPSAVQKLAGLADLWLFDLKLADDPRNLEFTGVSNELALKNLELLSYSGQEIIIRFPLIPGVTDDHQNMAQIAAIMSRSGLRRIDILPYHSIGKEKYRRLGKDYLLDSLEPPSDEEVEKVRLFFIHLGLDARTDH